MTSSRSMPTSLPSRCRIESINGGGILHRDHVGGIGAVSFGKEIPICIPGDEWDRWLMCYYLCTVKNHVRSTLWLAVWPWNSNLWILNSRNTSTYRMRRFHYCLCITKSEQRVKSIECVLYYLLIKHKLAVFDVIPLIMSEPESTAFPWFANCIVAFKALSKKHHPIPIKIWPSFKCWFHVYRYEHAIRC